MMNLFVRVLLLAGALFLAGCGGGGGGGGIFNSGSSASPPTDVKVTPGDSGATVTWEGYTASLQQALDTAKQQGAL